MQRVLARVFSHDNDMTAEWNAIWTDNVPFVGEFFSAMTVSTLLRCLALSLFAKRSSVHSRFYEFRRVVCRWFEWFSFIRSNMYSNVRISVDDDVQRLCRSCLSRDEKLIPLDKPYNHVVNTAYEYSEINERETIANLMMTCGNVKVIVNKCELQIRILNWIYSKSTDRAWRRTAAKCVHKMFHEHSSHFPV